MAEPIQNPDLEAIDWIDNWLKQRKDVVYESMKLAGFNSYSYLHQLPYIMKSATILPFDDTRVPFDTRGYYSPNNHSISYKYSDVPLNVRIHERSHSLFGNTSDSQKPLLILIKNINPSKHLDRSLIYWLDEKLDGILDFHNHNYWTNYYDTPTEIYSRLMELRHANNINPKKVWNKEEIKQLRNNKSLKDFNIFERYDDDFILKLFNEVADSNQLNNQYNDISYAKKGVKLIPKKKRWQ